MKKAILGGLFAALAMLLPARAGLQGPYGPYTPGEKVLIETGLVGWQVTGLPAGFRYDKRSGRVTGTVKKGTANTLASFMHVLPDGTATAPVAWFLFNPTPQITIAVTGDAKAKVRGAGSYLFGKKANLAATAPKGTAFTGWYRNGRPWPDAAQYRKPKISYVVQRESLDLVATFKPETVVVACDPSAGATVGAPVRIPVSVTCDSGVKSVAVSKLPSGVKYNKSTGCIEGAPKKAGTYVFTLTVQTKAGSKVSRTYTLDVQGGNDGGQSATAWAVGTYEGFIQGQGYDWEDSFLVQFIIDAKGTVTITCTDGGGRNEMSGRARITSWGKEYADFAYSRAGANLSFSGTLSVLPITVNGVASACIEGFITGVDEEGDYFEDTWYAWKVLPVTTEKRTLTFATNAGDLNLTLSGGNTATVNWLGRTSKVTLVPKYDQGDYVTYSFTALGERGDWNYCHVGEVEIYTPTGRATSWGTYLFTAVD